MGLIVFGVAVLLIGVALASNSLDLVDRLAAHWPSRYSRSSGGLMASTSFLIRFVSLLVAAAGAAIVVSSLFYR